MYLEANVLITFSPYPTLETYMVGYNISPMAKETCCANNLLTINYLKKYYPELSIVILLTMF